MSRESSTVPVCASQVNTKAQREKKNEIEKVRDGERERERERLTHTMLLTRVYYFCFLPALAGNKPSTRIEQNQNKNIPKTNRGLHTNRRNAVSLFQLSSPDLTSVLNVILQSQPSMPLATSENQVQEERSCSPEQGQSCEGWQTQDPTRTEHRHTWKRFK